MERKRRSERGGEGRKGEGGEGGRQVRRREGGARRRERGRERGRERVDGGERRRMDLEMGAKPLYPCPVDTDPKSWGCLLSE